MRILITNKRAPFEGRGAERIIWSVGQRLATAGHRVRFFSPDPTTDKPVPNRPRIDFKFVETSNDETRSMVEFFLRGAVAYRGAYRGFVPDVVYDNPSPFPFLPAHLYGDATVVSKVHAIYRRLAFACKQHPVVKVGTILGEETYRLLRGEYFVANSESTAERLSQLVDVDRNDIIVNPIGVDTNEFEFTVPEDGSLVVSLSKLSPRKRVGDLLRAWSHLRRRGLDARLVIAGSGPREDALHSMAAELGLKDVKFAGFVTEERKHELLASAGVLVSPTLYEGFGLVNLEAMASGCAVISTETWGVKDYLVDGKNGLTVPPKDPRSLADAIERVLSDDVFRTQLANAGRSTAESFMMEDSLDRELEILADLA